MTLLNNYFLIHIVFVLIVVEFIFSYKRRWSNYDLKDSLASLVVKVIRFGALSVYAVIFDPFFYWVYEHRLFTIDMGPVATVVFYFFLGDFVYYWVHRFAHTYSIGWASHATHHTLTKINYTNSGRFEITTPFSLYYFATVPFYFIGFKPILPVYISYILFFQYCLHTELIPKIPFLDSFMNTPSNHRVHHGTQEIYKRKNFGGATMIFDRLFGTYQAELEDNKPIYGIRGMPHIYNPFRICIIGWEQMFRGLSRRILK